MNDIGTQSPYFSFLICSHDSGRLVNAYINGRPIGSLKDGVFQPLDTKLGQLPQPLPFDSLANLKAFLNSVVDKIELIEETPIP